MNEEEMEMKYFDYQLAPPRAINEEMLASELKALRATDRKQKIDEMILNGQIQPKIWPPGKRKQIAFDLYTLNGEPFSYQRCVTCGFYVTAVNGGHKTSHIRRKCLRRRGAHRTPSPSAAAQNGVQYEDFTEEYEEPATSRTSSNPSDLLFPINQYPIQPPPTDKNQEVLEIISKYFLASGTSFEHVESHAARELMQSLLRIGGLSVYATNQIRVPSAQDMRTYCEMYKFGPIFRSISNQISTPIRSKSASIYLDFGVHIKDFACVFIVFVRISQDESKLDIKPLGFRSIDNLESGDDIKKWIIESATHFGISEAEILTLNLVTDGVDGVEITGFQNCENSGCSTIEKLTERVMNPTDEMKDYLTETELLELKNYQKLINDLCEIGREVKRNQLLTEIHSPIKNISISPSFRAKIRFAKDIFSIYEHIKNDEKVSLMIKKLEIDIAKMADLEEIFMKFEPLVQIFEKNEVSIHHFLPKITALNEFFKLKIQILPGIEESPAKFGLFKSAQLVTEHFLSHEISNVHFKTTMLSPGHRRMSKLSPEAKTKAIQLIRKELESVVLEGDPMKVIKGETMADTFDDDYDAPIEKIEEDELSTYLEETALNRDEPLVFWTKRQSEFPRLSQVAFRCFSLISTQPLFEKTFEKVQKVVDNGEDSEITEKMIVAGFASGHF